MAKCPTCGAPVNLAPDGDPKFEEPTAGRLWILRKGIAELRSAIHACNRNPIPNSKRMEWRDACDRLLGKI